MKKTYFITGGSGFIGRAITQKLSEQKNTYIKVFDNNYRGYEKLNIKNKKNIQLIKGDIRNFNEVKKYLNKNDTVIHLAYVNGTKFFYSKPHEVLEIAIKGLMNVIDACKKKM